MKNLNYKWVLLIGAVLGLIVGTYSKDDWEIISDMPYGLQYVNHTTGEVYYKKISEDHSLNEYIRWQQVAKPMHGFKAWFE